MAQKLYYCVVQDWQGKWTVSSFGGRNKHEERAFALSGHKRCVLITEDHDTAQIRATIERQNQMAHEEINLATGEIRDI